MTSCSAEPVAWRYRDHDEDFWKLTDRRHDWLDGWNEVEGLVPRSALLAANQRAEKAEARYKQQRDLRASDTDLLRREIDKARADRGAAEARANSLAAKLAEAKAKIAELEAAHAGDRAVISIQKERIDELLRWQRAVAAELNKEP